VSEWSSNATHGKDAATRRKHGVGFREVAAVFGDPLATDLGLGAQGAAATISQTVLALRGVPAGSQEVAGDGYGAKRLIEKYESCWLDSHPYHGRRIYFKKQQEGPGATSIGNIQF